MGSCLRCKDQSCSHSGPKVLLHHCTFIQVGNWGEGMKNVALGSECGDLRPACLPIRDASVGEERWFWAFFLNLYPRRNHPSVFRGHLSESRKACFPQIEILVPVSIYVMQDNLFFLPFCLHRASGFSWVSYPSFKYINTIDP